MVDAALPQLGNTAAPGRASRRVLVYGVNYAPEIAGVGRYTGEIGEALAAEGHDVTVVTAPPHYPGWRVAEGFANRWSRERIAGAEVFRCPLYLHRRVGGLWRLIAPLSFALSSAPVALWRALARRPEVVIAVEPTLFVAPLALAAARLVGARAVLHVQDLEVEAAFAVGHLGDGGLLARLARAFDRAMARGFDRVITISNRMAEKIADKGVDPGRIAVVRNWVDVGAIRPMPTSQAYRAELGLKPDDFVALYAGNIGAKQGVSLLIQAAEALADRPDIVFAVAGQGPMRGEVEAAAARLPNLRLYDFQPEARFGEFLSVADLHLLPQARDAADLLLPSKLGGMLASGRRVLVTADPGTELADFLGDSAILTPPGDAAALARAVAAAAAEPGSPAQQAERLKRAAALSKRILLPLFTRTALSDAWAPAAEPALRAA